jgi:hypothetical protein
MVSLNLQLNGIIITFLSEGKLCFQKYSASAWEIWLICLSTEACQTLWLFWLITVRGTFVVYVIKHIPYNTSKLLFPNTKLYFTDKTIQEILHFLMHPVSSTVYTA